MPAARSVPELPAEGLGLRPLTARSVLLSVLLGTHPPQLPVRALVRAGALFGIPDGTVRVALSRMVTDGDIETTGGCYRLTGRLLARQLRQDEGRAASTLAWDGSWELAIAAPDARGASSRAELAADLVPLRLSEWRDGVWTRPANLARPLPDSLPGRARSARIGGLADPAGLAAALWDLNGWAHRARELADAMRSQPGPALHFTISAATVAHLRDDPLLPAELLPRSWPGDDLRRCYGEFEAQLTALLLRAGEL